MILKKTVLEGGGPDDSGAILGMLAIGGMFIFTKFYHCQQKSFCTNI
jgi:hypothetical protein